MALRATASLSRGWVGDVTTSMPTVSHIYAIAAFAKVFLVRKRVGQDRKRVFAMKVLKKAKVAKDARYGPPCRW